MYLPISISIILQVACAVHAIKTGRSTWWLWIILLFSVVGCLIYLIVEILPEMRGAANQMTDAVKDVVTPDHKLTRLKEELDLCDSVKNRLALAHAHMDRHEYPLVIQTLQPCRDGRHGDDPEVLRLMAQSYFCQSKYAEAKAALLSMAGAPQKFESQEDQLLHAVVLQKLGEKEAALKAFETLSRSYVGEEARCRYAMLLKELGRKEESQKLFEAVVKNCKISPPFYRQEHKQWLEMAKSELKITNT